MGKCLLHKEMDASKVDPEVQAFVGMRLVFSYACLIYHTCLTFLTCPTCLTFQPWCLPFAPNSSTPLVGLTFLTYQTCLT